MKLTASGRGLVGGHDEVALVLAVLVVDDDEDPPLADLLERLLDGRRTRSCRPLSARAIAAGTCRSRPLSMFTAWPGREPPKRRHRQRVRDQHDLERRPLQRRHRQAHAVHRHRPCGISSGASAVRAARSAPARSILHGSRASTVPTPSTWPRTSGRRARRRSAAAARGSRASPAREAGRAPSARASRARPRRRARPASVDHREADAVDRDAGAELAPLERRSRAAMSSRGDVAASLDRAHRADLLDDPGEHQRATRLAEHVGLERRSSPSGVTVERRRGAAALLSSRPAPADDAGARRGRRAAAAPGTAPRGRPARRRGRPRATSPPPSTSTARTSRANERAPAARRRSTRPSRVGTARARVRPGRVQRARRASAGAPLADGDERARRRRRRGSARASTGVRALRVEHDAIGLARPRLRPAAR